MTTVLSLIWLRRCLSVPISQKERIKVCQISSETIQSLGALTVMLDTPFLMGRYPASAHVPAKVIILGLKKRRKD